MSSEAKMNHPHLTDGRFRHRLIGSDHKAMRGIPREKHERSIGEHFDRAVKHVRGKSVAIIGSSSAWMMEGPSLGDEIDGHDTVIRFNLEMPDPGQKEILGSKTTVILGSMFHKELWLASGKPDIWATDWCAPKGNRPSHWNFADNIWCVHPDWNRYREVGLVDSGTMASELTAKGMKVDAFPTVIDLYGFDFWMTPGWRWDTPSRAEQYGWEVFRKNEFDFPCEFLLMQDYSRPYGKGTNSHYSGFAEKEYLGFLGFIENDNKTWKWTRDGRDNTGSSG